jgi:putative membrane protein
MMWPWFHWGIGGYGAFGWIMPLMMLAFWGLVIWGIIALVRWGRRTGCGVSDSSESALETLKRRYASGEISREEYEEKKRVLT